MSEKTVFPEEEQAEVLAKQILMANNIIGETDVQGEGVIVH